MNEDYVKIEEAQELLYKITGNEDVRPLKQIISLL